MALFFSLQVIHAIGNLLIILFAQVFYSALPVNFCTYLLLIKLSVLSFIKKKEEKLSVLSQISLKNKNISMISIKSVACLNHLTSFNFNLIMV